MYWFRNDYGEGAHPDVLGKIVSENKTQAAGYGEDLYCKTARALIRKKIDVPDALVRFISGGTQTNQIMIAHALRPYEAVIAAETGHINVHETGAIEATGHKVLAIPSNDGKLTPGMIHEMIADHDGPHMVKPAMVYISNTTELGTHYTRAELETLGRYCRGEGLILYLDGARLASALAVRDADLTLADIARTTDCFSIGGTKNGALFGEALVITRNDLKKDIDFSIKQRGAMMAKGWLMGLQFQALLENDLYYEIGRRENALGARLREGITKVGYQLYTDSHTNQLFVALPNAIIETLALEFDFEVTIRRAEWSVARFVISWATTEEAVDALSKALEKK